MSTEISTAEVEESKESYWQRVLRQWQASGLKGREFQRRNNLSQHAFVYWKLKLMGRTEKGPMLVPVKLPAVGQRAMRPSRGIQIRAGELFTVELSEGFDPMMLREVLAAVREYAR